jgi:hypothetical protein
VRQETNCTRTALATRPWPIASICPFFGI